MSTLLTTQYLYKAPFQIDALSLDIGIAGDHHPNKAPFKGVLTKVDEASTRPPNGSSGHKVLIPRAVAQAALPSLQGMPINCSEGMDDHSKQDIVGVIDRGYITGNDLVVEGYLLAKNQEAAIAHIRQHKHLLGMSYEISSVEVANIEAPIWTLTNLVFTGAAILRKDAAAYHDTAIAAVTEEFFMAEASDILDKLTSINLKLDMAAAHDANADEEAAQRDEAEATALDEEATAAEKQAEAARADQDAADATSHDEVATAKRQAASTKRLAAAARYEALATRAKEASDAEATATYTAAATRLRAAHTEQQATVAKVQAAREQWASKATSTSQEASSDDRMVKLFGLFVRAMEATDATEDAAHDDEEEDTALFKRLMKKKGGDQKAASPTPDLQTRRWQRQMQASVELLTDTVSKMSGLLTDVEQRTRGLATDTARGNNGGPVRRSMQGTGEHYVGKFDANDATTTKLTEVEFDAKLQADGVTDRRQRMQRTWEARQAGQLQ